jgi:hypothetical protein
MTYEGGCLCRRIRYEASGEPVISGACYCRDCQNVSGGAPANVLVMMRADVHVTPDMPRAWWSDSARGNRVARYFCDECGTPLFAESAANPAFIAIKAGSLDDPSLFRPAGYERLSAVTGKASPTHRRPESRAQTPAPRTLSPACALMKRGVPGCWQPPTEDGLVRPLLATKRGRLDRCARADPFCPVLLEPETVCSRNGCNARG